jgi:Raf kinase inhibitor-like YbhB/YbcL family protein
MPDPVSHHYDITRTRLRASRGDSGPGNSTRLLAGQIELRTTAFNDHTPMPERHSYPAANISPPLEWAGIPDGTQELVLVCEDPDASAQPFTHWVVTNISPGTGGVGEGALPEGSFAGLNGFGDLGWAGPQPPVGDEPHRYFFCLYATDTPLGFGEGVIGPAVDTALDGHVIARGTLVGLFGR